MAYSRTYAYNPDGSRDFVIRDDAVNGSHWEVYRYDAVSGRLESVLDVWTGEVNSFVWNAEGTLARWENNQLNSYARVFGYDEEGRLLRIERDYGGGTLQLAYAYGYNSDGVRVWKRDALTGQEYRYVCRIGCGGVPMRVYNRQIVEQRWIEESDYLENRAFVLSSSGLLHIGLPQVGDIVSDLSSGATEVFRIDGFGEAISEGAFENSTDEGVFEFSGRFGLPRFGFGIIPIFLPPPLPPIIYPVTPPTSPTPPTFWPWPNPPYTPPPPVGTPDQCAAMCKDGLNQCYERVKEWAKTAWTIWGVFCGGSGLALGLSCIGLCVKAGQVNPVCLGICAALAVVVIIGCGIAAKWIGDKIQEMLSDCFDKYTERVRTCRKPKPKRCRATQPLAPMKCPTVIGF